MRIKNHVFFTLIAVGALFGTSTRAAVSSMPDGTNVRPVSQYGLIQNVQNYSTNPFWTKNSPYNQKFPQAVYVKGPELNSADCMSTVGALVSSYCASNNDCVGMALSDVRPIIMLQLSRMPGHNYATSCSGYIDSEFNSYVSKYANAAPNRAVTFPGATDANPDYDAPEFKLENPYEQRDWTWNGQEWKKERRERAQELEDLQSQNGAGSEKIVKADFPTTFADLSFSDRMDVKQAGYEPYKDSSAYTSFKIESDADYRNRLQNYATAHNLMSNETNEKLARSPNKQGLVDKLIEAFSK